MVSKVLNISTWNEKCVVKGTVMADSKDQINFLSLPLVKLTI